MADVAKSAAASLDASTGMFAPVVTGNLYAGEALSAVAPCYIKGAFPDNGGTFGDGDRGPEIREDP